MLGALIRMMAAAAALAVRERGRQLGRAARADELEPATWGALELAGTTGATDYLGFLNTLHRVGRGVAPFFERYDALLDGELAQLAIAKPGITAGGPFPAAAETASPSSSRSSGNAASTDASNGREGR